MQYCHSFVFTHTDDQEESCVEELENPPDIVDPNEATASKVIPTTEKSPAPSSTLVPTVVLLENTTPHSSNVSEDLSTANDSPVDLQLVASNKTAFINQISTISTSVTSMVCLPVTLQLTTFNYFYITTKLIS